MAAVVLAVVGLGACDPPPPPVELVVNLPGWDVPDADPGDGVCTTTPGEDRCTIRAAVEEAGASHVDRIVYPTSFLGSLVEQPLVVDPVAPTLAIVGIPSPEGELPLLASYDLAGPVFDVLGGRLVLSRLVVQNGASPVPLGTVVRGAPGTVVGLHDVELRGPGSPAVEADSLLATGLSVVGGAGTGVAIAPGGRAAITHSSITGTGSGTGVELGAGATATVTASTVSGHDVGIDAGGEVDLSFATVAGHATAAVSGPGEVRAEASVVVEAPGGTGCASPVVSQGGNGLGAGCGPTAGDVAVGADALEPLSEPPLAHHPIAPAGAVLRGLIPVGTGPCTGSVTDQLGEERAVDGACDAGAYEDPEPIVEPPTAWEVDSPGDEPDAAVGDGVCDTGADECTLRAALQEVDALGVEGPHAQVTILPGVDPVLAAGAARMPASNVTIIGNGATVDGNGSGTILRHCHGDLIIEDLTITGAGSNAIQSIGTWACSPDPDDWLPSGTVELRRSTITGNGGEGLTGDWESDTRLRVVESVISDNGADGARDFPHAEFIDSTVSGNGGPGYSAVEETQSLAVTRSRFVGNSDGIAADLPVVVVDSLFAHNTGRALSVGSADVRRSTFVGNDVVFSFGWESGSVVVDSTFSGNGVVAALSGEQQSLDLIRSTVAGNDAFLDILPVEGEPTVVVAGSVVMGSAPLCTPEDTFTSGGWNVLSDDSCGATATGDLEGVDALLGPLGANGGPTDTHLPGAGSPVIDHIPSGTPGLCSGSLTDQRGIARPQGAACDAGAVEQ